MYNTTHIPIIEMYICICIMREISNWLLWNDSLRIPLHISGHTPRCSVFSSQLTWQNGIIGAPPPPCNFKDLSGLPNNIRVDLINFKNYMGAPMNGIILIDDLTYFLQYIIKVKNGESNLKMVVGRVKPTNGKVPGTFFSTLSVN